MPESRMSPGWPIAVGQCAATAAVEHDVHRTYSVREHSIEGIADRGERVVASGSSSGARAGSTLFSVVLDAYGQKLDDIAVFLGQLDVACGDAADTLGEDLAGSRLRC